uniref:Uncharacterized protein n=1 Tax=viral metagenome TaxID=1070528 RepID=A0A6C0IJZ1_9ZZZZ
MKSPKFDWSFIYFLKDIIKFLLIFIFLYLFFYIIGYLYNYSFSSIEPFSLPGVNIEIDIQPTSKMKEAYRPYLRKARLYSEDFFDDSNNYVTKFLRKSGLY